MQIYWSQLKGGVHIRQCSPCRSRRLFPQLNYIRGLKNALSCKKLPSLSQAVMASPMESAHKENEQQKSPMVVSSEEVLEQATNKHPGIILLGGKTVSESIDHQPSATQENSQTLSSTPNTNAPEPKKKLSPLRPLWTRLTTAIVEEGTDGSTIPESPRLPPQIPQVRFSGYFEQSIQSKGSLDSAWKQPVCFFAVLYRCLHIPRLI